MSRHAECVECGRLLHLVGVVVEGGELLEVDDGLWLMRLVGGCPDCGGSLSDRPEHRCVECELFARRVH